MNEASGMRSIREVRRADSQCKCCSSPGFNPSILLHRGIGGAPDEAVLNSVLLKKSKKTSFTEKNMTQVIE
jgi:hypothetical protein